MKLNSVITHAAMSSVAMAGPIFGQSSSETKALPGHAPPAYAPAPPPPAYVLLSSFSRASTFNLTTTLYVPTVTSTAISTMPSTNSSLGSPVGFSNTTSLLPFATGLATTTSLPLTAPFTVTLFTRTTTTSLPLTGPFTVTLVTRSNSSTPTSSFYSSSSMLISSNYTFPGSRGSSIGSPATASSTGTVPLYTNATSTSTITSTSYVTVAASATPSLSFPSASRNGTHSTPSSTAYSTNSTLVSPITASLNSTSLFYPTGTVASTLYGTAPLPPSYSMILSTGIPSSTGSREVSPVTAGNTTSTTSTAASIGTGVSSYMPSSISPLYPNGTLVSPTTAPLSNTFSPTFDSASRLPGTGSTTSSVTNLETFPSIIPDSTSYTPSSGFGTITTAPTLMPYVTDMPHPYPYPTAYEYGGPGRYPAYDDRGHGSWLERLFRMR